MSSRSTSGARLSSFSSLPHANVLRHVLQRDRHPHVLAEVYSRDSIGEWGSSFNIVADGGASGCFYSPASGAVKVTALSATSVDVLFANVALKAAAGTALGRYDVVPLVSSSEVNWIDASDLRLATSVNDGRQAPQFQGDELVLQVVSGKPEVVSEFDPS